MTKKEVVGDGEIIVLFLENFKSGSSFVQIST